MTRQVAEWYYCGICDEQYLGREWFSQHTLKAHGALAAAALEAEMLLTNYMVNEHFPPGSDCEQVRDMLRAALRPVTVAS